MTSAYVWILVTSVLNYGGTVPPTPLFSPQQCVGYHAELVACGLLSPRTPASCFRYEVLPGKTTISGVMTLVP